MKKVVWGLVFWSVMAVSPLAHAAVTDWPIVGQVAKVGICILGGAGKLATSVAAHAGAIGVEVLSTVGECIQKVIATPVDVVTGVLGGAGEETHE